MFCSKCGREGKKGEVFCGGCGVRLIWEENTGQADAAVVEGVLGQAGKVTAEAAGRANKVTTEVAGQADTVIAEAAKQVDTVTAEAAKQTSTAAPEETTGETQAAAMTAKEVAAQTDTDHMEGKEGTGKAVTIEFGSKAFVIKKTTIKKVLLGTAGFIAAVIFLVSCLGSAEIRGVKNGVLEDYNYGVSIGDALHKWFGGTEKWSSSSEGDVVYVMARGITKYTFSNKSQEQIFLFHYVNDEYFVFDGAFDSDGDYLYTGNEFLDALSFGDLLVSGAYNQTLRAAFGDEETLKRFTQKK